MGDGQIAAQTAATSAALGERNAYARPGRLTAMARVMPARLTLIGRVALWRGSQELLVAASGQRLIALLALRDRPVGRLHVAGTLWPDYPTERSLAVLRTTLWRVSQSGE